VGVPPQAGGKGTLVLVRGPGVALLKSAALTLVSVQPWAARKPASVLDKVGAAWPPSEQLAVP